MELLRFITAGSVDDGKSTLIGRLLYDSKSILADQLEAIEKTSQKSGGGGLNLALLTDGLKAEREQGITIDVAYKYFQTDKRKFIIADAPGHIQYTRNMFTGASIANLAIILIDARKGVIEQTYRHSYLASLLRIPHLVVCINKMDLIDYDREVYEKIQKDFSDFAAKLDIHDIEFIPISALNGDNIVNLSENMDWYEGKSLLHFLEEVHIESDVNLQNSRFPVQYVMRPNSDFRGYAGQISAGIFKKGDKVSVLPSGFETEIKTIHTCAGEVEEAYAPMSVTLLLKDELDVSRGDMIVKSNDKPEIAQDIHAYICWMDMNHISEGKKLLIRHTTREARVILKSIKYKVDINTFNELDSEKELKLNDIAFVHLRTSTPLFFDEYAKNKTTGNFILIDEDTNLTVAAGIIKK